MKNSALLIVAYYLSKFDEKSNPRASLSIGCKNTSDAFVKISLILGVPRNTVKNHRDIFDQLHPNREGWKYPIRPRFKVISEALADYSEKDLLVMVNKILLDQNYRMNELYLSELGIMSMSDYEDIPELFQDLQKASTAIDHLDMDVELNPIFKVALQKAALGRDREIIFGKFSSKLIINDSGNKLTFPNMTLYQALEAIPIYQAISEFNDTFKSIYQKLKNDGKTLAAKAEKYHEELEDAGSNSNKQKEFESYLVSELNSQNKNSGKNIDRFKSFIFDSEWRSGKSTGGKRPGRSDTEISTVLNAFGVQHAGAGAISELVLMLSSVDENWELFSILNSNAYDKLEIVGSNQIIYGAPGTGKSYAINKKFPDAIVIRTVFHAETQNNDFLGTLLPVDVDGKVSYQYVSGPFIKAFIAAIKNPEKHICLIIEEINRANAASVFGEIFQLLDRDASGRSEYSIDPDQTLHNYLLKDLGEKYEDKLYLPSNLSLVASMNSSDQAVFPLDAAFKRRWSFEYIPINFNNAPIGEVEIDSVTVSWKALAIAINEVLKSECGSNLEEDRFIGPWFLSEQEINNNFEAALVGKLFTYLWNDVLRHHGRDKIFNLSNISSFGDLVAAYYDQRKGNGNNVLSDYVHESLNTSKSVIEKIQISEESVDEES